MRPPVLRFDGVISGARFASGDTIVVGAWRSSPFGVFTDAMWSARDGGRVLFAGDERVLDFVGRHYRFDEVRLADVRVRRSPSLLRAEAGPITLEMTFDRRRGATSRLLRLRPSWLRTWRPWIAAEDVVVRPLLTPLLGPLASVRTRGRTIAGAPEWYAIHDFRPARTVQASVHGEGLGAPSGDGAPAPFGFSEFPRRAGSAQVTSMIAADVPGSLKRSRR